MRYKYYYCQRYREDLIEFLERNQIQYQVKPYTPNTNCIIFSLYSSMKNLELIMEELRKNNIKNPIATAEYTAKEFAEAKLLWMRPYDFYVDILNEEESVNYTCKWLSHLGYEGVSHYEQIDDYVIYKVPSSKSTTAFFTTETDNGELFADIRIRQLVEEYQLKGFEFRNVYQKNRKRCEEFFQVKSTNVLKEECMEFGHGEKEHSCPACGKKKYFIGGTVQLHFDLSKIEENRDLYVTERIFGEGIEQPIYIISQKFYRLLKEKKLAGKLKFYPIADISK